MITKKLVEEKIHEVYEKAINTLPEDVKKSLENAIKFEK